MKPGDIVSHYRIVEQLGAGGMGVVFKAEDQTLGRFAALKFLPLGMDDPDTVARFKAEARSLSALNHSNICTIYEVGTHEGRPFMAMELLEGQGLHHLVGTRPLPIPTALDLSIQVADALDVAHSAALVHRDIKPANILITTRGQAKLLDFGLAKAMADRHGENADVTMAPRASGPMTQSGITMGTVAYMSPEQARGEKLDGRSDIFSFGLVLYQMVTGRQTFAGNTAAVLFDAILNRTPVPVGQLNPSIPAELERIVSKAIEKDLRFRYQTASDLRSDLQRLKRDLESGRVLATSAQVAAMTSGAVRAAEQADDDEETGLLSKEALKAASGAVARAALQRQQADAAKVPPVPQPRPEPQPVKPAAPVQGRAPAKKGAWRLAAYAALALIVVASAVYVALRTRAGVPETTAPEATTAETTAPLTPDAASTPPVTIPPADDAPVTAPPVPSSPAAPAVSASRRPDKAGTGVAGSSAAVPAGGRGAKAAPSAPPAPATPAASSKASEEAGADLEIARAKIDRKLYDQALADLRAFAGKHPGSALVAESVFLAADVQRLAGRREEAMGGYVEFGSRYKSHARAPEALFQLALLTIQSGRPGSEQDARGMLGEVADTYPQSSWAPRALLEKAALEDRLKLRQPDQALGVVEASIVTRRTFVERFPSHPASEAALWSLGSKYEDLKRYAQAAEAFEKLASTFTATKFDAWFRAAELYERRLKDKAKAKAAYAQVPASSPRYKDAQKKAAEK